MERGGGVTHACTKQPAKNKGNMRCRHTSVVTDVEVESWRSGSCKEKVYLTVDGCSAGGGHGSGGFVTLVYCCFLTDSPPEKKLLVMWERLKACLRLVVAYLFCGEMKIYTFERNKNRLNHLHFQIPRITLNHAKPTRTTIRPRGLPK